MNSQIRRRQQGFSLLEVLVAVVIMSIGLLALATLQLGIMRSSAEAKTQSMGINLARDRLEDLLTYRTLEDTACPGTTDSYRCITSGSDTAFVQGGVSFSRTWTVQRCLLSAGTFSCTATNQTAAYAGTTPRNEFKVIDVFVSWTDSTGVAQAVSVKDSISAYQPSDVALLQKKSSKLTPRFAREKIYDPSDEAGVIPIAVGGGTESAATNPKPEMVVGESVVETRFDVMTYSGLSGDTADAQSRVETAMVGCTCDFDQKPAEQDASLNSTRAKRPTYWNGFRYVAPEDSTYVPKAGVATNQSQSARCNECCRDHHDPSSLTAGQPRFSPYISLSSAHPHYLSSAVNATAVTTGQYREACRLIRVDGIFRVAADLRNDYYALLATENRAIATAQADSPLPDNEATTEYQAFVIEYLNTRYTNGSPPNPTLSLTGYNNPTGNTGAIDPFGLEVRNTAPIRDLDAPATISFSNNDEKWLHSRGLYIDYLEQDARDAIAVAKVDTACTVDATTLQTCILKLLPFTSINLTEIADWDTSDSNNLVVTEGHYEDVDDVADDDEPVNGRVTQGGSPGNNVEVTISTDSFKFNTSLLNLAFGAISPTDALEYTDGQVFDIGGSVSSGSPYNGDFYVYLNFPSGYPTQQPEVRYVTGTKPSENCGDPSTLSATQMRRKCVVANAEMNGTDGLNVPGGMAITYGGSGGGAFNYTDTVAVAAGSGVCTNTNSPNQGNLTIPAYTANRCYYLEVSSVSNSRNTTRNENSTALPTIVSGGGTRSEVLRSNFVQIDKDPIQGDGNLIDRIDVTLTQKAGSPVTMGVTCTYTCNVNPQNGNINCNGNNLSYNVAPAVCP